MADRLIFDPATGTQYYESEASHSYAYYQAIARDPAHQQAIAEAQAAIASGELTPADAISKFNPDATIKPASQVLTNQSPVDLTHPNAIAHDGQETHAQTEIRIQTGVDTREGSEKQNINPAIDQKPSLLVPAAAVAALWFLL